MKQIIVLAVFVLGGAFALAEDLQPQAYIGVRSISPCSFWSYTSSPNGGSGYLCSSYTNMSVADGYQTQNAVDALEARIRVLEDRVKNSAPNCGTEMK